MTQPRRIAATSCAERIAHELGQRLGVNAAVGYAVRFAAVRATRLAGGTVHVCTPGVLLRRLLHTPLLGGVSHVIVDEVHCRDVFSDVVLLAMKRVLRQRRGSLRLVLMSATAGVERLKKFFEEDGFLVGAPFAVQGTAFPVRRLHLEEIVTLPAKSSAACENALERESLQFVESEMLGTEDSLGITPFFLIMQLLRHIVTREPGSGAILIFLPGIEEISTLHELLLKETEIAFGDASKYAIYTLHSSLPTAASLFVRAAAGVRKIVLSTNIAESSVTVPDVEFVVDTARHKVLRFSHAKRLSVLATEWISKTNVRQRMGRAGRCQPGVYFLLASRERADDFSDDVTPEILLESLDATVLTAKRLFPAQSIHTTASALLDAPPADSLQMALERLQTLKVLDGELQLTRLGSVLSNFPLLPAFSKLVVLGCVFRCLDPMLTMAATANEKLFAVRYDAADKQHTLSVVQTIASDLDGVHPFSDHMIACEIVTRFSNIASEGARIDFCRSHSLQYATLSRVLQIKRSLRQLLCSVGLLRPNDAECGATAEVNRFAGNTQLVRALLLMSLYPDVAWRSAVKRNHFKTKGVSYGAVPSTSGCYHVGSGSLAALQKSVSAECAKKMQGKSAQDFPATYVFDSAIDTGNDRPLFTRVTAIDPAMLLLACNAESVFAMRPDADALKIDDWLALCGARPDAMLLVALGQLMQRFVEHKLATLLGENAQGSLSKSPVEHENAFLEALDLLFKKVFNAS